MSNDDDNALDGPSITSATLIYFHIKSLLIISTLFTGAWIYHKFEIEYVIIFGQILGAALMIALVLMLVRCAVESIKSRNARSKTCMLIGLGGMSVCSIAARVWVFYVKWEVGLFTYTLTTIATILFYIVFMCEFDEEFEYIPYLRLERATLTGGVILALIHIVALIFSIKIATLCNVEFPKRHALIFLQVWFALPCVATTVDFYMIATGVRKLKTVTMEQVKVQKAPAAPPMDPEALMTLWGRQTDSDTATTTSEALEVNTDTHHIPRCKMCNLTYNTSRRTPRILTECYHTICQDCAEKLLADCEKMVEKCPYCQMVTAVNGPAEKLPKNFALLEVIESNGS